MKYLTYVFSGFLTLCIIQNDLFSDNRIILYLKNIPESMQKEISQEADQKDIAPKITKIDALMPGQISKKLVKKALQSHIKPHLSGLMAIYGGYADISNHQGLISFPLRHITPKLYLAITPTINLVKIKGNTFSHQEFVTQDQNSIALYSFELKKDEKQNSYWDVKEEKIPENKKINPITMVILTNPKNLFVPCGTFFTSPNIQLVLPDIFVISRSSNEHALLQALDLSRYFEPIAIEQKKVSDYAIQIMITNI